MEWCERFSDEVLLDFLRGARIILSAKRQERAAIELEIKEELDTILAIREELNKRGVE